MLHVVHHPDYISPGAPGSGFRYDKYGLVMAALRETGAPFVMHEPAPMPRGWIEEIHDAAYVEEVFSLAVPAAKARRIGFPVTGRVAARSVLSPGGTWLAAQLALAHGHAANAAGGSHHALAGSGAGYCVFNDLAIAANRLIAEGTVARILIVDLDVHQGDGTAALLAGRAEVATFSMHAEKNFPVRKARSTLDVALPDGMKDDDYLTELERHLPEIIDRSRPELILYQAGVDPHGEDRLGRLSLTDAGLEARDRMVVREARARSVPVASTLGGGYGADRMAVARRHARSMLVQADEAARASGGTVPAVLSIG